MDLHQSDPQVHQAIHVARGIACEARVHAAVGQQALGVSRGVLSGEGVRRVGEAHHVGGRVVDEPDTPHAGAIHHLEQRLRILHDLDHAVAIHVLAAPHDRERRGLELAPRLDVHVHVGDPTGPTRACPLSVIHGAQKLSHLRWTLNRTGSRALAPLRRRDT